MVKDSEDWIFQQHLKETLEKDHYFENGKKVFKESFHIKRGFCCGNGCRHCPYDPKAIKGNTNLKIGNPGE